MRLDRVWAMPSHRTFSIPAVASLLREELGPEYVDPFPFPYVCDALDYLKTFADRSVKALAFDPPYSQRQLVEMYKSAGLHLADVNNGYWARCRDEIARVMAVGGKVVSFGWNSTGIGKDRGFRMTRVLLVAHGSQHNDTICTVEEKVCQMPVQQDLLG